MKNILGDDEKLKATSVEVFVLHGIEYRFKSYETWDSNRCLDWYYLRVYTTDPDLRKEVGFSWCRFSSKDLLDRATMMLIKAERAKKYTIFARGQALLRTADLI